MVRRRRGERPDRAQQSPSDPATPGGARRLMAESRAAGNWVAGYRVVRKLGSSSTATVYLGHPGTADGPLPTVALKVFDDDVPLKRIDTEIDALTGVDSRHVLRLLDVAMAPGQPRCLVLERLTGGSVAALLGRGELSPGAAVTILVAAARGLEDLHTAGFSHDRLTPASLLLDATGRPVLTALGHAARLPDGALASWSTRSGDHSRLALLCHTVFDAVAVPAASQHGRGVAEWLQASAEHPPRPASDVALELEDRLFDLAEPQPLLTRDTAIPAVARGTGGAGLALPPARPTPLTPASPPAEGVSRFSRARTLAARLIEGEALSGLRAVLVRRLRERRRPLMVGGLVGGALLLAMLALVPATAPASPSAAPSTTSPSSASPSSASPPTTDPKSTNTGATRTAITADDPVAAVTALLARRAACLRTASLVCLDEVDQVASPLLDSDQSFVGRRANDPSVAPGETYTGFGASLIQRSGGSALVALTPPRTDASGPAETPKPASALVIEGEAGWRLRELFVD